MPNVLWLDDSFAESRLQNPGRCTYLVRALCESGLYQVFLAANVADAVRLIETIQFSLVLVDRHLAESEPDGTRAAGLFIRQHVIPKGICFGRVTGDPRDVRLSGRFVFEKGYDESEFLRLVTDALRSVESESRCG